jgi:hypothetical protein
MLILSPYGRCAVPKRSLNVKPIIINKLIKLNKRYGLFIKYRRYVEEVMIVLGKAGPRKVGPMERAYGNGKAGSDSHSAEGKRKMPLLVDLSPAACNQQ